MKLQSLPAVSTVLLIFDRVNDAIAITIYPALNCKINKHAIGVSTKATSTMSTHFPANLSKHIWLEASPTHTPTTAQTIFLYKQAISTATLATTAATVSTQLILAVNNNHNVTIQTTYTTTTTITATIITMPTAASIFFDDNLLPAFFVNSNNINIINNINSNTNTGQQTHISNNNGSNSNSVNNYNGESVDHDNTTTTTTTTITTYRNETQLNWIENTTNSHHDNDNLNSFYFYETEQFAVLWILFIVIVLGNSAVLLVMFMNKNRKSRMNYFIKQLALADLCVGLLHVLTDIIWHLTVSWRAGNIACKIIRFSQVCVTYSSTYVLVAMSIDRYDAITHPMNFSKSWKRARHLVAAAWIISAIFALPILLLYEEKSIQGRAQCWIELGTPLAWQIYMSLVSATLFAFPALIISACYTIIVKTIWAKGSMFVSTGRGSFMETNTRRASSRGNIPKAKVKTIKMTFVIVIVFIVCWSPYIIFDLLQVFGHVPQSQTNIAIATFIQSLAPLNSAANPLIYCLFSSTVFRTFSRLPPFKWFSCCCKTYRQNPSTQPRCSTVGRRLHNSCDSMRTLTTSLTVSRRSQKGNTHVMICERPKSHSLDHNALSQV